MYVCVYVCVCVCVCVCVATFHPVSNKGTELQDLHESLKQPLNTAGCLGN